MRVFLTAMVLVASLGFTGTLRAEVRAPAPATVLMLFSDERLVPSTMDAASGLDKSLSELSMPIHRLSLFLDSATIPTADLTNARISWYRERFAGTTVDVVVTLGDPASQFAATYGKEIWPQASAVYIGRRVREFARRSVLKPAVAVVTDYDYVGTAVAALRMVPGTRSLILLAGAAPSDASFLADANEALLSLAGQVNISRLSNLPFAEYKRRLASLPADAIVMPVLFFADSDGRSFAPPDAVRELAAVSARPFFSVVPAWVGNGVVGGNVIDYTAIGRIAGRAVGTMLNDPAAVPETIAPTPAWTFDARELRKWSINRGALPAGSVVLYEEPGPFTKYRTEIIVTAAIITMQAGAIAALVVARRRRREVETFNRVVMESMAAETAVLDRDGRIISTNDLWRRAQPADGNCGLHGAIGDHYCASTVTMGLGVRNEDPIRHAVESVLKGEREEATVEYRWTDAAHEQCWSQVRIRRLARDAGGALIKHVDLTSRRRAETELQRQLHEHAHLTTIATVGETAGAMAHELNQPLAAVLSNAQALRHVLASDRPDAVEVESIIQDIIDADRRAADVITRVRRLIRKDAFEMSPVDVNAVARDAIHIIKQTPGSGQITLSEVLSVEAATVSGDRVQLQQVIINLLQNAMQAVRARGKSGGWVSVSSSIHPTTVEVVVHDNGAGIPAEEIGRVFDPFFTTKREGLGLGLSISRSIVELHGGTLKATNRPEGGATFSISLPRAVVKAIAS